MNTDPDGFEQEGLQTAPSNLTPADVFFREASQVDTICECLLSTRNKSLKDIRNQLNGRRWWSMWTVFSRTCCKLLVTIDKIGTCIEEKSLWEKEPEYIPWTATSGPAGIRTAIVCQHRSVLKVVYPQADSNLRNVLTEQLVALIDGFLMLVFLSSSLWTNPMIKKDIAIWNGIPTEKIRSLISASHTRPVPMGCFIGRKILWLWYLGTNVWADWQPDQITVLHDPVCWSEFFRLSLSLVSGERKVRQIIISAHFSAWTVGELFTSSWTSQLVTRN